MFFKSFILASTNGYSVITSPAPSAALSPYEQKMYEAMSTDVKKKSMKKVNFRKKIQIQKRTYKKPFRSHS